MKLGKNIIDYIRERYNQLGRQPGFTRIIIDEVREKFNQVINKDHIRYYCKTQIDDLSEKIEELNDAITVEEPYEYRNGRYIIQDLSYTGDEVNEIFDAYSKYGKNYTEDEIIRMYGFNSDSWLAFKRAVRLTKKSNVIGPEAERLLTPKELEDLVDSQMRNSHDRIRYRMVRTNKKLEDEELKKYRKIFGNMEYQLNLIRECIKRHETIEMDFSPIISSNNDIVHVIMSDIHFGKLDTMGIIRRMDQLHQDILSRPESTVYITCLGDIVETLAQGGMHPGQIEYGTEGMLGYGFELMLKVVDIFEKFLISIRRNGKKVYFKAKTGNHGRMTTQKHDDIWRSGELVMYELIKKGLANMDIEVEYFKEVLSTFDIDGIQYIAAHGDNAFHKRKPTDIAWKHSEPGKQTIIISGDIHQARLSEDKNITMLTCSALAGRGRYDTDMDLYSSPGYVLIKKNKHGLPSVTFERLI